MMSEASPVGVFLLGKKKQKELSLYKNSMTSFMRNSKQQNVHKLKQYNFVCFLSRKIQNFPNQKKRGHQSLRGPKTDVMVLLRTRL